MTMNRQELVDPDKLKELLSIRFKAVKVQGVLSASASDKLSRYARCNGGKSASVLALQIIEDYVETSRFKQLLEESEVEYLLKKDADCAPPPRDKSK